MLIARFISSLAVNDMRSCGCVRRQTRRALHRHLRRGQLALNEIAMLSATNCASIVAAFDAGPRVPSAAHHRRTRRRLRLWRMSVPRPIVAGDDDRVVTIQHERGCVRAAGRPTRATTSKRGRRRRGCRRCGERASCSWSPLFRADCPRRSRRVRPCDSGRVRAARGRPA